MRMLGLEQVMRKKNIDEADGVGEGGEAEVGNEEENIEADGVGEGVESGVANEAGVGNKEDDIDEDYVATEGSYEDNEFQFSGESDVSEMNWTKVLPQETLGEISSCEKEKDQIKGLVPAVQAISDNMECRLCVKHLYGNWKKRHSGLELKEVLWAAARATTIPAWEKAVLKMKTMKEDAWKDMVDIPASHWSRSHFNTYTKCDLQVNNMCEAFNRAILEHREKPIITLLEGIKQYITKRIANQKELLQGYTGSICPKIQLVIEKHKQQAQGWSSTWHGDDDISIFGVTNGNDTYCVDLKKETCSCRKWQLTGIPCSHVIACIWNIKKKPEEYVASCYRKSTFMETYSHIVYPTNGLQLWPVDDQNQVEPPVMRKAIGRPKKQRNKTNDEPRNPHILPRRFSTVTSPKCGAMGHNKRSCKGKSDADRAIPKGGNKPKKAAKAKKVKTKEKQIEIGQGSQAPQPTQE
ncbi:uncharacterized protein LOC131637941 [Vicia villosa]|uniref:uncharacterized protein LOC131637941 n=1 Tax=Vicia villosa TaxID=3911 RepID=UPI00273B0F18|nr:uncharacterized protein LOC131637941 [Vicia villosa]